MSIKQLYLKDHWVHGIRGCYCGGCAVGADLLYASVCVSVCTGTPSTPA